MTCGATPQLPVLCVHVHSCGGSVGQATYQSTLPPISILQQHCLKLHKVYAQQTSLLEEYTSGLSMHTCLGKLSGP